MSENSPQDETQAPAQDESQVSVQNDAPSPEPPCEPTIPEPGTLEETCYHWNYSAQLEHDRALEKKQRRRGGAVYALIMTSAFLLCLAVLVGVLIWYQVTASPLTSAGDLSSTINTVAETVKPATVLIYTESAYGRGYGTGFFLRDDGYIATNYHVVEDAASIKVRLYSGKELDAEFIDGSAPDDLAIIKVKGVGYPVVTIGNSDALKVGDLAIAIGNPGGPDAAWTTTSGIISATNRTVAVIENGYSTDLKMIQTDAPLNHGNSGGPLCNARGEVIGIVSRKLSDHEGIGFAIPVNEAIVSLSAMIDGNYKQNDSTVSTIKPNLGITVSNISAGTVLPAENNSYTVPYNGVQVIAVEAGSSAEGKLAVGDVIYAFEGVEVADVNALRSALYQHKIGDTVTLSVFRQGGTLEIKITLKAAN